MALWNEWICSKACQVILLMHIDLFTHTQMRIKSYLRLERREGEKKRDERLVLRKVKERWRECAAVLLHYN